MRSSRKIFAAAFIAALLVAPQLALAEDSDEQQRAERLEALRRMDAQMSRLEEQLEATNDELEDSKSRVETNQERIEKAELDRTAQSGLSAFLSQTQFSGYVSASYNYNFNQPNANIMALGPNPGTVLGTNTSNLNITAPYHPNHNSFQLDQFFLSMMKPATAESRGGFGVDLVWGTAADNNGNPAFNAGAGFAGTGDNSHLFQAYVEYLADIGDGLNIKLGRFDSLFGAESFRDDENWNITRGNAYAIQPVNQTGILVSLPFGDGFEIAAGGVNSYANNNFDSDNDKTFIGRLGWTGETASLNVNALYGGDVSDIIFLGVIGANGPGKNSDSVTLIDVVTTWDPTENLSFWANFDFYDFTNSGTANTSGANYFTYAVASRLAIGEATGASLRFEYIKIEDIWFSACCPNTRQDLDLWNLTGTLDHALSNNLTVKLEARYDRAYWQNRDNPSFSQKNILSANGGGIGAGTRRRDQILVLAQAIYRF